MLLASVNGAVSAPDDAHIPVTDESLLRGDGAFEVIRLYDGRPFAMEDHYARLGRSCAGLRLTFDEEAVRTEMADLLAQAGPQDGLLRIVITRGGRRIGIVEPVPSHPEVARVHTVTFSPSRVLDGLKTLSYGANMLAGRIAREHGADEALLVTPHGRVLEGPTWALFWVGAGELRTPPLSERILASITRARLIAVTGAREAVCTMEDLERAEEAFIGSTVREVLPIGRIDDIELPAAPGPATREARAALAGRIEQELAQAAV